MFNFAGDRATYVVDVQYPKELIYSLLIAVKDCQPIAVICC